MQHAPFRYRSRYDEHLGDSIGSLARGAYQFVVGDDLDTLRDEHASGAQKFLAIVDLSSNALLVVPVFGEGVEAAKFAFKAAVEVGTRAAAREISYDEARELSTQLAKRGVRDIEEHSGGVCACFPAGARIATAQGGVAISALQVGDRVLAENPTRGTVEAEPVQAIIRDGVKPLLALTLSDGSAITVTANHPFWLDLPTTVERGGWITAGQLRPGDHLRTANGQDVTVTAIRRHVGQAVVYTLTVARDHTFFVGQARVLVHNCNVPNYYDLGWDPTRKEFIESEARGGARLQQHLGLRLMRYTKNADFDFVDSNGTLYDLVGPLPRSAIGKASAQQFIASIRDHLYKISTGGKVVIDLEGFTHEAQDKILQYLTDLPPSLR